jgi:hypothetical protein
LILAKRKIGNYYGIRSKQNKLGIIQDLPKIIQKKSKISGSSGNRNNFDIISKSG